ncbi:DUF2627 family protein [Allobacillus halotolerans]|uniref:DUF2627 domain-containing protein n=1 Tax=Allobacillus halotolerans TaxID=570278 RepID=A0ABS6GK82_9BACI|nr:DUF2627 family protein [Allobacillus halotolerans]MBU6079602.1 DUF2627 domain-containing protein [Allobacillus halotolerans]
MIRLIALILLLIPGVLAAYGIKLLRDSFFGEVAPLFINVMIQFSAGVLFIIIGIGFIGGFIYRRDQKKNKTKDSGKDCVLVDNK